jgi:uncharacterized lipoprotein YbaY
MSKLPLVAALAVALAAPARAEITADELWALAQASVAEAGGSLTAQENRRGPTLVLRRARIDLGEGVFLNLPDITLRETPERAVAVELPARFPLAFDLPGTGNDPSEVTLTVSAPDFALLIRNLEEMAADFSLKAPSLTVSLDPVNFPPGSKDRPDDLFLALAAADIAVDHNHTLEPVEKTIALDTTLSLGAIHAEMRADIPSESTDIDLTFDLASLAGAFRIIVPPGAEAAVANSANGDPGFATFLDLLDRGMLLDAKLDYDAVAMVFDGTVPDTGRTALSLSMASGGTTAKLDRTEFVYDSTTGATRVFYQGTNTEIPLPEFEFSLDEYRIAALWGLPGGGTWGSPAGQVNSGGARALPTAGKWGLIYELTGLTVSPGLWDLFDPGRTIPRDPISFVVDLSGDYALDPKVLEPAWKSLPEDPPPFSEISVKLAEFLIAGAGASITGKGDVVLDFLAMKTIDDVPEAKGSVGFVTMGVNGLLDRLASLGLLSDSDLQGARLALMFIGKIEGGQDRLVTTLDFDGAGITLNGQKIR